MLKGREDMMRLVGVWSGHVMGVGRGRVIGMHYEGIALRRCVDMYLSKVP